MISARLLLGLFALLLSSLDCQACFGGTATTQLSLLLSQKQQQLHQKRHKHRSSAVVSYPSSSSSSSCLTASIEESLEQSNRDSSSSSSTKMSSQPPATLWFQHEITITAPSRGCHLITGDIQKAIGKDLSKLKMGMANLFIQHTSASLTINENADPDVRRDLEVALNKLVPAAWNRDGTFLHTMEGDDDMPGHVKSSLMGASLNVPIRNGRLALGTWQGIYLNEHRDQGGWGGGHARRIIITLQGQQQNTASGCLSGNSDAWLRGQRLGNIAAPNNHRALLGLMDDKLQSSASSLLSEAQPALRQTICHPKSAFFNESNGSENDLRSWTMRLLYLAMHHHQHRAAQPEAHKRLLGSGSDCQAQLDKDSVGSFDYECPNAKFIVAALPTHGLGSVMRLDAVRFLLLGLAFDRVVLFVNRVQENVPPTIKGAWGLASCPRKDYQCFFQPLSPCVATMAQMENATIIQKDRLHWMLSSNYEHGSNPELENAKVWVLDLPNKNKLVPDQTTSKLHRLALELIDDYAAAAPTSAATTQRMALLRKAAERILKDPNGKNGDDRDFAGAGSLIKRAALIYTMRPNVAAAARLAALGQGVNDRTESSKNILGLPIRASDKCGKESECLSFEQYMRMMGELWNSKVAKKQGKSIIPNNVTIVLTSESTKVIRDKDAFLNNTALVQSTLPFANSFQFVSNDGDVRQGTGNSRGFKKVTADDVMFSTFSALQAQLLPAYSVGNCCSNFHNMLFDFLRGGCGAVQDVYTQCLQRAPNPEFWICCWPKQKTRCVKQREAALAKRNATLALKSSVK